MAESGPPLCMCVRACMRACVCVSQQLAVGQDEDGEANGNVYTHVTRTLMQLHQVLAMYGTQ